MNRAIVFVFILFSVLGQSVYAQDQTYIEEQSLQLRGFYYDSFDDALLPIRNVSDVYPTTYFVFDRENNWCKKLVFNSVPGLSVFVNGRLLTKYEESKPVELLFSDVFNDSEEQLIVFFKEDGYNTFSVKLVTDLKNLFQNKEASDKYLLLPLELEQKSEVFVFLAVIFAVFAYLRFTNAQYLYAYFDLTKMFSRQGIEEYIYLNPFSGQSIIIMLSCSMLFAIGMVEIQAVNLGFFNENYLLKGLFIGGVLFALMFGKQLYLLFLNVVFGDVKLLKYHYFEYARLYAVSSVLFCLTVFGAQSLLSYAMYAVAVFWMVRLILVLIQRSSYRKMYLISYLCASEIFPLLITFKLTGIL